MPTPANVVARSRLSAWAFLTHSTNICPDRSFLVSLTVPAIPNMPLWMAKGDSLARGLSFSVGSRMMNRGQSSLAETVRASSTF